MARRHGRRRTTLSSREEFRQNVASTARIAGLSAICEEDKKIKSEDKIAQIKDLLPLIKRPEEKRLTISVLSGIPSAAGLDILTTFANDNTVSEEASMAIVKVATGRNQTTATKEIRRKALQVVVEKAKNEGTKENEKKP